MADRIVYSSKNLTDIAVELGGLSDTLTDVECGLSGIDTSAQWWGKLNILLPGGRSDARNAIRILRADNGKIKADVDDIIIGIRKTLTQFDEAERKVSAAAKGISAGRKSGVYANPAGPAAGVTAIITHLWNQAKNAVTNNNNPHGGGGRSYNKVFDDYGAYGGSQSEPKDDFKNYSAFRRLIFENTGRPVTDSELKEYLGNMNQEGCGYVAVCNIIFLAYEGRAAEFEKTFGYPMYAENGDFNFNMMIVDYYSATDDPNANGTTPNARTKGMREFLKQHGVAVKTKTDVKVTARNFAEIAKTSEIVVSIHPLALQDEKGKYVDVRDGGHAMTVTGFTEDGRIVVSSWGKRYYINPQDAAFSKKKDSKGHRPYIRYETYSIE